MGSSLTNKSFSPEELAGKRVVLQQSVGKVPKGTEAIIMRPPVLRILVNMEGEASIADPLTPTVTVKLVGSEDERRVLLRHLTFVDVWSTEELAETTAIIKELDGEH